MLTVVTGSSGSGKTTFLNDAHDLHKCVYIRQFHNLRPYITVSKIPEYDPTGLPFWDLYIKEGKSHTIRVGGTLGGNFIAGLSGGQRKLMIFDLVYQRTRNHRDLLILLDEPFAGVTDDFLPFIQDRLNKLREIHNIVLVTNDHVSLLRDIADNTITVSAVDRTTVMVNNTIKANREDAMQVLSVGKDYTEKASWGEYRFFWNVEVARNRSLLNLSIFYFTGFLLFLVAFLDSDEHSSALLVVASRMIALFCFKPFLITLVDWRNLVEEETQALLHSSKNVMKALKGGMVMIMILIGTLTQWAVLNVVSDSFAGADLWVSMLLDTLSIVIPFVFFGLYTNLPLLEVDMVASIPFVLMVLFSTTFSPGSGKPALNWMRYLFPRFYFWCKLDDVGPHMQGCPHNFRLNMGAMFLAAAFFPCLCVVYSLVRIHAKKRKRSADDSRRKVVLAGENFAGLWKALYGDKKSPSTRWDNRISVD